MILLYDVCFEKRPLVRSLPDQVPFIAIAAAAAFLTLLTQSVEYGGGGRTTYHGGSVYATLLTMLPVLASYLGMIFWPARLSAAYAPAIKSAPDMEVAAAAILLALVAWCAVHLFRRERSVFFWLALFPLGLLPVSQLVPLITLMNDRYLYYPMVGMAPFLAIGVTRLARNGSRPVRRLVILVSVAVLAMLAIAARQRTGVWQNAVTLWGDAVAKVPHSPTARYSLAEAYFKAGRYEDAKPQLFEVTRMFPAMVAPHELLGNVFYASGDLDRAAESYRSALALKPDLPMANLCLGNIHLSRKEFDSARMRLLAAEKVNPDAPDVAYSLACVEALLGRNGDALAYLEKAFVKGFKGCQAVELNHELDSLRGLPEYIGIMTRFCGERSNR